MRSLRQRRFPPTVTALIPTLNEAENIGWVLERTVPHVDRVLVVDGQSTDRTIDEVRSHAPAAEILTHPARGKGAAIAAGLCAVKTDQVVMLDADGSMDPAEIPAFIAMLNDGFDLVKGTRYAQGGGSADLTPLRNAGNRALSLTANSLFGQRWSELCYGYAAMWSDIIEPLGLHDLKHVPTSRSSTRPSSYGHGFEIEALLFCRAARHRYRVGEIGSHESERRHGDSNLMTFRDGTRVLGAIVRERVRKTSQVAPCA